MISAVATRRGSINLVVFWLGGRGWQFIVILGFLFRMRSFALTWLVFYSVCWE